MGDSRASIANQAVPILTVCREIGMEMPEDTGRSIKVYCPFGNIYHRDRGIETAFRVYPETNSAYCFAGCGYYSPVWLYAQGRGVSLEEAAETLLEIIGWKPVDPALRWEASQAPDTTISRLDLSEALKVYCAGFPSWEERQFDAGVSMIFAKCLKLLPMVNDQESVQRWLAATKTAMAAVLSQEERVSPHGSGHN